MNNSGTFVNFSIGNACNLRCKFCYNDEGRTQKQVFIDKNKIFLELYRLRNQTEKINLIGGEPLFHPDIFEILEYIKELNFTNLSIVTNGVKLADADFTERLLKDYDINSITISIHSNNNVSEDVITQRKDILNKKIQGLNNVFDIKKKVDSKVHIGIALVINQINIDDLDVITGFYQKEYPGIDISLSGMILGDFSSEENISMIVTYQKIRDNLQNLVILPKSTFSVHWIPLCIHKNSNKVPYIIRELTPEYIGSLRDSGENLFMVHKGLKTVSEKCLNCSAYGKFCNGLYDLYFRTYGDSELISLSENDLSQLLENNKTNLSSPKGS